MEQTAASVRWTWECARLRARAMRDMCAVLLKRPLWVEEGDPTPTMPIQCWLCPKNIIARQRRKRSAGRQIRLGRG